MFKSSKCWGGTCSSTNLDVNLFGHSSLTWLRKLTPVYPSLLTSEHICACDNYELYCVCMFVVTDTASAASISTVFLYVPQTLRFHSDFRQRNCFSHFGCIAFFRSAAV